MLGKLLVEDMKSEQFIIAVLGTAKPEVSTAEPPMATTCVNPLDPTSAVKLRESKLSSKSAPRTHPVPASTKKGTVPEGTVRPFTLKVVTVAPPVMVIPLGVPDGINST